jgi:hypothetical protein
VLSPSIFFSNKRKKRKRKTIEKKKNAKKEGSLPLSSRSTLSFLALASTLLFQALSPSIFFSTKQKKQKKTIKKIKDAEKGGSLSFFSRFCIWDEALLLLSPLHIPSMLSSPPSSSPMSTSPQNYVLLKLKSSPKLWRWR